MTENRVEDRLMTVGEVAKYFAVDPKTVTRWRQSGRLPVARFTPGGHARFWESDVRKAGQPQGGAA